MLGDTICEYDVPSVLTMENSVLGVKRVDDPRDFGVVEIDEHGLITRVVEKPQIHVGGGGAGMEASAGGAGQPI